MGFGLAYCSHMQTRSCGQVASTETMTLLVYQIETNAEVTVNGEFMLSKLVM